MSKIDIKTTLISPDATTKNEIKGILLEQKLLYEENNSKIAITIGDDSVTMVARSEEHILNLTFKEETETHGIYTLLSTDSVLNINIFTKLLQIENNYIKIIYNFNDEERCYEIEYEVIV